MWWNYGWVCCSGRPAVNTIYGGIMVGFVVDVISQQVALWLGLSLFLSVSKHNMWWKYGWVCCSGRPAVNTIYGGIMVGFVVDVISQQVALWLGLSLCLSVSKHNMWWKYGWVCCSGRPAVNTIYGGIMVGFVVDVISQQVALWLGLSLFLSVSKHNMWWKYGWVCCSGRPAVNTIYGGIMVGFVVDVISQQVALWLGLSLFLSVSKHNMWWKYGWVCCSGRPAVNTIYGGIMVGFVVDVISQQVALWLGLSLFLSVSKHNMWWKYGWVCCCCRPAVAQYMVVIWFGVSLSLVSKHNMWS